MGEGEGQPMKGLALMIRDVVGVAGDIVFDRSKPDGAPRKLLDTAKIRSLGWTPGTSLAAGLPKTYHWYQQHLVNDNANVTVSSK